MTTDDPSIYEPTEDDRVFARGVLDRADELNAHYVLGCVEACVDGPTFGEPVSRGIRRARAFLAEWRER